MTYTILHVGDPKENYYREAFEEYRKRMQAYGSLEDLTVKPAPTPGRDLKPEEIRLCLRREAAELEKALAAPGLARAYRVALCVEGKMLSSEDLAREFDRAATLGRSRIVFLIGGSWGLDETVKASCDLRLSFSPMTFPHSLFRVMLAEQIYRAAGILAGSGYHK